ncbi:hypothetical protein C8Q79DRAFT_735355 [Trametes meyenii]|nr:hypothetical protein C8Q79DRAFT_735355 [Trametes meyenii]
MTMPRKPESWDTATELPYDFKHQTQSVHEYRDRRALSFSGAPPWLTEGGFSGGFHWPTSGWEAVTRTITDMITASSTETANSRATASSTSTFNTSITADSSTTTTPRTTTAISPLVSGSPTPSRSSESATRHTLIPNSVVVALAVALGLISLGVLVYLWWRRQRSRPPSRQSPTLNHGPNKRDLESGAEERTPSAYILRGICLVRQYTCSRRERSEPTDDRGATFSSSC